MQRGTEMMNNLSVGGDALIAMDYRSYRFSSPLYFSHDINNNKEEACT